MDRPFHHLPIVLRMFGWCVDLFGGQTLHAENVERFITWHEFVRY